MYKQFLFCYFTNEKTFQLLLSLYQIKGIVLLAQESKKSDK
jgi:hypothetical protein